MSIKPGRTCRIPTIETRSVDPSRLDPAAISRKHPAYQPRLVPERWPEIGAGYVSGESLRALGKAYGVSHEAIR
jgi:hypothetical protein